MAQLKDTLIAGSLRVTDTIFSTNLNLSSLTASQAVLTDASKNLVSRAITDNTTATAVTASTNLITANTLYYHKGNSNIVTVGTVTSGTWNATTINPNKGGTGIDSYAKGDILYAGAAIANTATTALSKLAIGTAGYFLKATANGPAWANTTDITALGTVTTGTWSATTIAIGKGGTGVTTWAKGGIVYASAKDTFAQITDGTADTILRCTASATYGWLSYTSSSTASTIVYRDASKNFSAGTITANLSGNATRATYLIGIGRLNASADAIAENPCARGEYRVYWNIYDSTSRNKDATNSPSYDASCLNMPWDWGGYNSQIAIGSTGTARMQIRSASHTDNGEGTSPRYTPSYTAWREVVTATKATQMGSATKPIYISNTGQVTEGTAIGASGYHADSYFVKTSGDTMSGNLLITTDSGDHYFEVKSNATGVRLELDNSGSTNHGLWSSGYWSGSAYTASSSWMIYRNASGTTIVNGNCTGSSGSCTGNAATCTTANGLASLVTATRANHSADTGVIVQNTDSTNPLKIGYIIGSNGNAGIYDFTHSVWKIQIAPDGTTTFRGNVTGSSGSCTGNAATATTASGLAANATCAGKITLANNTWNAMGDDCYFGDVNVAGCMGLKGINGTTGIYFVQKDASASLKMTWTGTYLALNDKNVIQASDSWLRINEASGFSSGVYFGGGSGGVVRTDNQFQVGGSGSAFCANSSGNVTASSGVNAKTIFANQGASGERECGVTYGDGSTNRDLYFLGNCTTGTAGIYDTSAGYLMQRQTGGTYKVFSAVWNDYAEYRKSEEKEPGRVTIPNEKGIRQKTTDRLQAGARIISDTFGIAIGQSDEAQTPIGLVGRVLAYPYRNRSQYHIGDCVCSAPNGTIDIMSRQEIKEYPECIIGIVDEIPDNEIWQAVNTLPDGNKSYSDIKINGRIWIDIK